MRGMMTVHRLSGAALWAVVLGGWGCSSEPATKSPTHMEGVAELPPAETQQIATYRCSVDLQSGKCDVKMDRRSGPDEEAAWNNLSPRIKQGNRAYEVSVEVNGKNAKGPMDWAFVTVLETDTDSGKLLRKIPVYEFWGKYDRQISRALLFKDGRLQFFVQFWTAS